MQQSLNILLNDKVISLHAQDNPEQAETLQAGELFQDRQEFLPGSHRAAIVVEAQTEQASDRRNYVWTPELNTREVF